MQAGSAYKLAHFPSGKSAHPQHSEGCSVKIWNLLAGASPPALHFSIVHGDSIQCTAIISVDVGGEEVKRRKKDGQGGLQFPRKGQWIAWCWPKLSADHRRSHQEPTLTLQ